MRIGFALPNSGAFATPEGVLQVARRAEDLGYDGLWTFERILYAVKPQNPYPGAADGRWPETFRRMLDPLDTLTFVASQTKKISLGTSVLDIPYYNPVILARRPRLITFLMGGCGSGLAWGGRRTKWTPPALT